MNNNENILLRVPKKFSLSYGSKENSKFFKEIDFGDWRYNQIKDTISKRLEWLKNNYTSLKDIENLEKLKELGEKHNPKVLTEQVAIIMLLAYYIKNKEKIEDHPLKEYISYLCSLPNQGNSESINYIIDIFQFQTLFEWIYDSAPLCFQSNLPNPRILESQEGLQIYKLAVSIVWTRSIVTIRIEDNLDTKENVVLVTGVDLFNHRPKRIDENEKQKNKVLSFTLLPVRNKESDELDEILVVPGLGERIELEKGDQIYLNYGESEDVTHHGIGDQKIIIKLEEKRKELAKIKRKNGLSSEDDEKLLEFYFTNHDKKNPNQKKELNKTKKKLLKKFDTAEELTDIINIKKEIEQLEEKLNNQETNLEARIETKSLT